MSSDLRGLIGIVEASEKYKLGVREILLDALEGKVNLFFVATGKLREALVPCKEGELHHASPGEFIHQYIPLLDHISYVDIELGQVISIKAAQARELIVKGTFSEVELYRSLAPKLEGLDVDFWKTEREVYDWVNNMNPNDLEVRKEVPLDKNGNAVMDFDWVNQPPYKIISLEQIQVRENELMLPKAIHPNEKASIKEASSSTALKVIGLLMHHLAKSPKYASGTKPNKSQIKELLIDLAEELNVDPYGLNKVDERVLTDAMKYLDNQKR